MKIVSQKLSSQNLLRFIGLPKCSKEVSSLNFSLKISRFQYETFSLDAFIAIENPDDKNCSCKTLDSRFEKECGCVCVLAKFKRACETVLEDSFSKCFYSIFVCVYWMFDSSDHVSSYSLNTQERFAFRSRKTAFCFIS